MMSNDDIEREVSSDLFHALLAGTLKKVGKDSYQLTKKGEIAARESLKTAAGLRVFMALSLGTANLTDEQREPIQKVVDMVFAEFEHLERTIGAIAGYAKYRYENEEIEAAQAVWAEVCEFAQTNLRETDSAR